MVDGLANFGKYLADVTSGKGSPAKILAYSTGEIGQGGVLLAQARLELA